MSVRSNKTKVDQVIIGATLDTPGDEILTGQVSHLPYKWQDLFRNGFADVNLLKSSYASLLLLKDGNSGKYLMAHMQGLHVASSPSRTYNTRNLYLFDPKEIEQAEFNFLSIVNSLPPMKVYKSREGMEEVKELKLDQPKPGEDALADELYTLFYHSYLEGKQVFIELEDPEIEWQENMVRTHQLSQSILKAFNQLPLALKPFLTFAFSVDNAYHSLIKDLFVVTYRQPIPLPDNVVRLRWSASKQLLDVPSDMKKKPDKEELNRFMQIINIRWKGITDFSELSVRFREIKKDLKNILDTGYIKEEQKLWVRDLCTTVAGFSDKDKLSVIYAKNITDFDTWKRYILSSKMEVGKFRTDAQERFNFMLGKTSSLKQYPKLLEYEFILDIKTIRDRITGVFCPADKAEDLQKQWKDIYKDPKLSFLRDKIIIKIKGLTLRDKIIYFPELENELPDYHFENIQEVQDEWNQAKKYREKSEAYYLAVNRGVGEFLRMELEKQQPALTKLQLIHTITKTGYQPTEEDLSVLDGTVVESKSELKLLKLLSKEYPDIIPKVVNPYKPERKGVGSTCCWVFLLLMIPLSFGLGIWLSPFFLAGSASSDFDLETATKVSEHLPIKTTLPEKQPAVNHEIRIKGMVGKNTKEVEIVTEFTHKGLVLKPLIDSIGNNLFKLNSVHPDKGDSIVFPKVPTPELLKKSDNIFAMLDSLETIYKSEKISSPDYISFYGEGELTCYHNNDTAQVSIANLLRNQTNRIELVVINGRSLLINNDEFKAFNGNTQRKLDNFTYALWLLNQIQEADSLNTTLRY